MTLSIQQVTKKDPDFIAVEKLSFTINPSNKNDYLLKAVIFV